ncbi:MAG: hypothetical protein J6V47_05480 [Bacteroidaceae bacterium]|nr:hypothetical protein [Bacteroidaceae bacterium]
MRLDGKSMRLRVNGKTIALSNSCTFNTTTQTIDAKTKDDAKGPYSEFDFVDWTMGSENLVGYKEETTSQILYKELLALQLAGTEVEVSVDLVKNASGAVPANGDWESETAENKAFAPYKGMAWIESLNLSMPKDGKATLSVNLKGNSPLSLVD